MHPAMLAWLRSVRRHSGCGPSEQACASAGACGGGGGAEASSWAGSHAGADHDGDFGGFGGGGSFGVRRPLRFLAHKLDLNEKQIDELARILNDLKTERAQAAVDNRRAVSAFADLIAADSADEAKLKDAANERVKSAERLRDAIVKALGRIHVLLDSGQRARLAYLIRTGALLI